MKTFKPETRLRAAFLIAVLVFQMSFAGAVFAQADVGQRQRPTAKAGEAKTRRIELRITGKTPRMLQTRYMNFWVTEATEVVNSNGEPMTLADLPVPCSATLYYESGSPNNPVVWRVLYRGPLSGARTSWSAPIKQ